MSKEEKFEVWQNTFDQLHKVSSLLKPLKSVSAADLKKVQAILKKTSSFSEKNKELAPFFFQLSGIVSFLKKDLKSALDFFLKAVKKSNAQSGEPYLWLSYTYLELDKQDDCFKWLAEAYKVDKQSKAMIKNFENFNKVKNDKKFKSALGILSKSDLAGQKIDPAAKQLADFILETPDWEWYQLYGLSKKNKTKFKDKASYWDAVIVALSPAVEDALEHELKADDVYDDMYTLKFLKDSLAEAKAERKKLGSAKSYFFNTIKDVI